tara:strand:+ start:736 stop:876 length:141 start_codon:yes stop_codon:yes gene_type:complete
MIKLTLGILIGGSMAMMFPDQAAGLYDMIRGTLNEGGHAVVEATNG